MGAILKNLALDEKLFLVNYFIVKEFSVLSAGYHNIYSVLCGLILVLVGGINTSYSLHCVLYCCTFQRNSLINKQNNVLFVLMLSTFQRNCMINNCNCVLCVLPCSTFQGNILLVVCPPLNSDDLQKTGRQTNRVFKILYLL